ncbi:Alpha/Beta hydrolase protein [Phaeosphaeria sp. MPI-PUGE-AT-0046c]|nr:Alpha/Beta hydrolase protein [Phaeosphaeria sp. MPI-PUGE-AT-0046c]
MFPFVLLSWLGSAFAQQAITGNITSLLTVNTSSGAYTGFVNSSLPNVHQWLGIPFGTPPVDNLRFLSAVKALYRHDGPHPATTYKSICPQNSDTSSGVFWTLVPEFQNTDPQSEDCLYLNIWAPRTPALKKEKVPVLIWVFGGAFAEGGGHAPYQVPDRWIEKTQGHVVVTFNYRVNVFGFPSSAGAFGNPGLTDIRLVVEWVRDNIEGFGGDSTNMLLWGQSAGANAVISYSYAHPTDPIVQAIAADSGVAPPSIISNTTGFSTMARSFGCGENVNAAAELTCMQKVDAKEIQKYVKENTGGIFAGPRLWGMVADEVTAFGNLTERLLEGKVAKIPLITGVNKNEGAAFAHFELNQTVPPQPEELEIAKRVFVCSVDKEANDRVAQNMTVYRYLFKGNFSNITPRYWLGSMHSSELPLLFGTHDLFRGNSTPLEFETSRAMQAFWLTLVSNSTLNPIDKLSGLTWPKYTGPKNGTIMVFGDDEGPGKAVAAKLESVGVMEGIYPLSQC